jgi:hypothetical protein
MLAKEIPGGADDALPRLERGDGAILHGLSSRLEKSLDHLTRV